MGDRMTEADLENVLRKKALQSGSEFYETQLERIYNEGLRYKIWKKFATGGPHTSRLIWDTENGMLHRWLR